MMSSFGGSREFDGSESSRKFGRPDRRRRSSPPSPTDIDAEPTTPPRRPAKVSTAPKWLRIVGGEMGGQRVLYSGDPNIRPMKDRTRESVFNLIGGDLTDRLAIDLFAGTGAMGLESISRGATRALMLELLRPAVTTINENIARLKVADRAEVQNVDTLRWFKYLDTNAASWLKLPWVVFCCPPYRMWETELDRLRGGLNQMLELAPLDSLFVVESEMPFDIQAELPAFEWDVRLYKPAVIGVAEKVAA